MTEPMTPERFVEKYRRSHLQVEDDWYSCPLSEEGCSNDDKSGCCCGAEAWNTSMPHDFRAAVAHAVLEERRAAWRTALTLANNLCVQISDRLRDDDGPTEAIYASADCAKRVRGFIEATDEEIEAMIVEAGYAAAIRARGQEPPQEETNHDDVAT